MKELLDKLSSYNIFNYLLPGVLFAVFIENFTTVKILHLNILVGVFVYYFLGLVVSRVGSLILEPALLRLGIIAHEPYDEFIRTSKIDVKLELLSETNNMYRTIGALMLCIAVAWTYSRVTQYWTLLDAATPYVCVAALFALFVASYRKQTAYIRKRIASTQQ